MNRPTSVADTDHDARLAPRTLSVGVVRFLNAWPLTWGLAAGNHDELFEPVALTPAEIADGMRSGELDAGLLPSIELQRIPDLRVVPGLCIASAGAARSVVLVTRRDPGDIERLALDASSRTSATLARIILHESWGVEPECVRRDIDVDDLYGDCDAAVVIGDRALELDRDGHQVIDLATAWRALTGLPTVFAVWAVREEVATPGLERYFQHSFRFGLANLPTIVSRAAREFDLGERDVHGYLTQNLTYHLEEPEHRSLEEFFRRAEVRRLIPEARPIRYLDEL